MENSDKPTLFKRVDNFVRGMANGMTLGMADTIAAAGNTVAARIAGDQGTVGVTLDKNLAAEAAKTLQAHKEGHEARVGEFVGPAVLGGAAYAALRGAPAAATLGRAAVGSGNAGSLTHQFLANFGRVLRNEGPMGIGREASVLFTRMTTNFMRSRAGRVAVRATAAAGAVVVIGEANKLVHSVGEDTGMHIEPLLKVPPFLRPSSRQ
jgi:hypothetical protein